jgi:hypothetical protein
MINFSLETTDNCNADEYEIISNLIFEEEDDEFEDERGSQDKYAEMAQRFYA